MKRCSREEKKELVSEFVNVYRHVWGTAAGLKLNRAKVRASTCRELRGMIRSLKRFPAPVRKR